MKIGIAGAGGIGSNVAMNLVRAGISNFKILDFDCIEESNLNRQFYFKDQIGIPKVYALYENLKRINPELEIEVINTKLNRENISNVFQDCNIVVEAFDKKEYKIILIEELAETKDLIISASGIGGTNLEKISTKKLMENIYIVGDFESDIKDFSTYSTKVNIVAAMMANIIIEKFGKEN